MVAAGARAAFSRRRKMGKGYIRVQHPNGKRITSICHCCSYHLRMYQIIADRFDPDSGKSEVAQG
jgi:hypothetical protein